MTEQIRKDFEKWAKEERGYSVERFESEPHQYVEQYTHVAWTAWVASRERLTVELPMDMQAINSLDPANIYNLALSHSRLALQKQGVQVKE